MEATNSLNIFTPTQTRVVEVATPPKVNPPSLREAFHLCSHLNLTNDQGRIHNQCQPYNLSSRHGLILE